MIRHATIIVVLTGFIGGHSWAPPAPPEFPASYTASGVIITHGSKSVETFTAYCDSKRGRYRIDYRCGETKTLHFPTQLYRTEWATDEETGIVKERCLVIEVDRQKPQGVLLPDLTNFELIRMEPCDIGTPVGNLCENDSKAAPLNTGCASSCYRYEEIIEGSENASTSFLLLRRVLKDDILPVRYNTTEFEIVYSNYTPGLLPDELFEVKTGVACAVISPGSKLSVFRDFNPMRKLVNRNDSYVDEHCSASKAGYVEQYANARERSKRRQTHVRNLRFENLMNRRKLLWALETNQLTDSSQEELEQSPDSTSYPDADEVLQYQPKAWPKGDLDDLEVPREIDWREKDRVSPVKRQGKCKSCWAFAAAGQIEGQYSKKHRLIDFSAQELVDCSKWIGNKGCDGGFRLKSFKHVMAFGLSSEIQYPYKAKRNKCQHIERATKPVKTIKEIIHISDEEDLRKVVGKFGPVAVSLRGIGCSFDFYTHGIYRGPAWFENWCVPRCFSGKHAVLVVGYGSENGTSFWLIKNSWGTSWGEGGYMRMVRGENLFNIGKRAFFIAL